MSEDLERWRAWIGRHEEVADTIDLGRARAILAVVFETNHEVIRITHHNDIAAAAVTPPPFDP